MALSAEQRQQIIKKFQHSANDVGSSEVQIALLTESINKLTLHLKANHKDFSSRKGLMDMVSKRRKLLDYLKRTSNDRYKKVIDALNIRR